MKIKSLLLGSVAAMGLSAGAAVAADVPMVMSLGLCDGFGVWDPEYPNYEGDTHCVRVSGSVDYTLEWGDTDADGVIDWDSTVEANMRWIGIANGTTGPVAAVIGITDTYTAESQTVPGTVIATESLVLDEAYAQALIGDNVYVAGGLMDSIQTDGQDNVFDTFFDEIGSDILGVGFSSASLLDSGGHSLAASVDLGDGLALAVSLEDNNNGTYADAGDLYAGLTYSGSMFSAYALVGAGGILDTAFTSFGGLVGATATFDSFTVTVDGAVDSEAAGVSYSALATAALDLDGVVLAVDGGVDFDAATSTGVGFFGGAGVHWVISDDVTAELAAAYVEPDSGVAADDYILGNVALIWTPTDIWTVTALGEVTYNLTTAVFGYEAGLEVAADLGGGFNASLAGMYESTGAYTVTASVSDDIE